MPTFFRCPWNESPEDCDIGLVGVPHSTGNGSTERDQHLGLRGFNIVGADIVCPMPTVDSPNQITALTGSVLMFKMLSLIADYLRG